MPKTRGEGWGISIVTPCPGDFGLARVEPPLRVADSGFARAARVLRTLGFFQLTLAVSAGGRFQLSTLNYELRADILPVPGKSRKVLLVVPKHHIVVHYHELWLKGGNRHFFIGRLVTAVRQSLEGLGLAKLHCPGDRILIELEEGASIEPVIARLERVLGVAYFAVAREIRCKDLTRTEAASDASTQNDAVVLNSAALQAEQSRALAAISEAAWSEVEPLKFTTFAVRAKRSDKSFPMRSMDLEIAVGGNIYDKLLAAGRAPRVNLNSPDVTCHIEITKRSALVYARKISGVGGMPANTAGRLMCLLSGGFDSAVAAYKMMRRGAHVSFVHFWGGGADPGESSTHVARELVRQLVPYQFTAKLFLVPFEPLQREIVDKAPANFRILLYRRLMLRIAEQFAYRDHALGLVTGDSLGQVASQTLHNMNAVGAAAKLALYRPLAGDDKQDIIALARKIGTHDISAEPFHDCCPLFLPKSPALHASPADLDAAEAQLDMKEMVRRGVDSATLERYQFTANRVEQIESFRAAAAQQGS
jgi:thiamine biosynthesis protein ThiI